MDTERPDDVRRLPHGTPILVKFHGKATPRRCELRHVESQGKFKFVHQIIYHGPIPVFSFEWAETI